MCELFPLRYCTARDTDRVRRDSYQHVHVVPVDRPRIDDHLMSPRNLTQQLSCPLPYVPAQHQEPIFRDPHHVILAVPNRMATRLRILHCRRSVASRSPEGEAFTDPKIGTLNPEAEIRAGLLIKHASQVWVTRETRIGVDCTLSQMLSIGSYIAPGAVKIGDCVHIVQSLTSAKSENVVPSRRGGDCRCRSEPVTIGDEATISSGSLVLSNVLAGHAATGVLPCRRRPAALRLLAVEMSDLDAGGTRQAAGECRRRDAGHGGSRNHRQDLGRCLLERRAQARVVAGLGAEPSAGVIERIKMWTSAATISVATDSQS